MTRSRRPTGAEPPERGSAAQDREPDPESVARAIALRLLTGAPRSRHQIAEAMARRDVDPEVAERVLDRLTDVGLIDDAAYAEMLVRSQRESRGLARRALAVELRRRGVGDDDLAAALDAVAPEAEAETARELLRRRWRDDVDVTTQTRRAMAMLARKGYPPGLSRRLVAEMVDDRGDRRWEEAPGVDD